MNAMSSFLSRSFRRLLHSRHEGMIIKNLSAGQNNEASRLSNPWRNQLRMTSRQVVDKTWEIIREEGAVIEEALPPDEIGPPKPSSQTSPMDKIEEIPEGDEDNPLGEGVDEKTTSPADAVVSTSFNEKSGRLHGYEVDVIDVHPDDDSPQGEDGQGLS